MGAPGQPNLPPEILDPGHQSWQIADGILRRNGGLVGAVAIQWDHRTGSWLRTQTLPERPSVDTVTLADGTQLFVGGKESRPNERFPIALNSVSIRPAKGAIDRSLRTPRIRPALTHLPDGRVLVTGGYRVEVDFYDHDTDQPAEQAEIIDPRSGLVLPGGQLVKPRDEHGIAVLQDGSIMLVGGRDGSPVAGRRRDRNAGNVSRLMYPLWA